MDGGCQSARKPIRTSGEARSLMSSPAPLATLLPTISGVTPSASSISYTLWEPTTAAMTDGLVHSHSCHCSAVQKPRHYSSPKELECIRRRKEALVCESLKTLASESKLLPRGATANRELLIRCYPSQSNASFVGRTICNTRHGRALATQIECFQFWPW